MNQDTDKVQIEEEKRIIATLISVPDVSRITYTAVGWTSRVYLVNNGEIVFKFPRTEAVKEEYRWELQAYDLLKQTSSSISTPRVEWTDPDYRYFGYYGIIGQSLDSCVDTLSHQEKESIGHTLGNFLKEFHQCQLPNAPEHSLEDTIRNCLEKYTLGIPVYQEYFNATLQEKLYDFVHHTFPDLLGTLPSSSCLCHGDLGPWNILIDNAGLPAIIDFGDVGYYDPSIDFSGMHDDTIRNAAVKAYGYSSILNDKITLRRQALPILEVPYYAGKGNTTQLQEALQTLTAFLQAPDFS